jgi:hypothetical protein
MPQYGSTYDLRGLFSSLLELGQSKGEPRVSGAQLDLRTFTGETRRRLVPIQQEVSLQKLHAICARATEAGHALSAFLPPLVVRGDLTPDVYYVLDGHHRAFSHKVCPDAGNQKLDVFVIRVPGETSEAAAEAVMRLVEGPHWREPR